MPIKFIFIIFIAIFIIACNKNKEKIIGDQYVLLSYKQTGCADAWTTGSTDSLTLVNLRNYLISKDLYIASLSIKQDGIPEPCYACTCKTGKTITVSTFDSETLKAKYALIGFK